MKSAWALLVCVPVALACKSKVEVQPDPATVKSLESCQQALEDAQRARQELEAKLAAGDNAEVVIAISGDLLKITGGKGPNGRTTPDETGNAKDEELYQKFIASVRKSRSAIEQCYRRALKNDTTLQARTMSISISVNYSTNGAVSSSSATPRISDSFNTCMEGVAKGWNLPAMPKAATFKAPLTLTPET
jgi:hypothetical protein